MSAHADVGLNMGVGHGGGGGGVSTHRYGFNHWGQVWIQRMESVFQGCHMDYRKHYLD